MATWWTRADGQARWLEFLDGVPATEVPVDNRVAVVLDWLDGFMPFWQDQLALALTVIAMALAYRLGR